MFCATRPERASNAKIDRREVHPKLLNTLVHKIIKPKITASGEGILGKYYYVFFDMYAVFWRGITLCIRISPWPSSPYIAIRDSALSEMHHWSDQI